MADSLPSPAIGSRRDKRGTIKAWIKALQPEIDRGPSMNVSMNGKPITAIHFSGGVGGSGNPERIRSTGDQRLSLSATYHGDHDEFWVIKTVDGKETDRYRCSHVDHIEWAPDADRSEQ